LPINAAVTTFVPCRRLQRSVRHAELIMPVSAYIQAALFVLLNAVALFAAAGTIEILGFWVYVAIFAAVMVASFAFLDPGLLRERMRPGGQRPPLALRLFGLVLILHWIIAGLDFGRRASLRSRPATGWRSGPCWSTGSFRRWCASSPTAASM
jgi:hypothetical protein